MTMNEYCQSFIRHAQLLWGKTVNNDSLSTSNLNTFRTGDSYKEPWRALAGWFLGPRAENCKVFNELAIEACNWHAECRKQYYPDDPSYFINDIKDSTLAKTKIKELKIKMKEMNAQLTKSIPFFSTRYQVFL